MDEKITSVTYKAMIESGFPCFLAKKAPPTPSNEINTAQIINKSNVIQYF